MKTYFGITSAHASRSWSWLTLTMLCLFCLGLSGEALAFRGGVGERAGAGRGAGERGVVQPEQVRQRPPAQPTNPTYQTRDTRTQGSGNVKSGNRATSVRQGDVNINSGNTTNIERGDVTINTPGYRPAYVTPGWNYYRSYPGGFAAGVAAGVFLSVLPATAYIAAESAQSTVYRVDKKCYEKIVDGSSTVYVPVSCP